MDIRFHCSIPRRELAYRRRERVAVMIGKRHGNSIDVEYIVPVPNVAKVPADAFAVRVADVRMLAGDLADHIVGAIHSHPNDEPMPSKADLHGIRDAWVGAVFCGHRITSWYAKDRLIDPRISFPVIDQAV